MCNSENGQRGEGSVSPNPLANEKNESVTWGPSSESEEEIDWAAVTWGPPSESEEEIDWAAMIRGFTEKGEILMQQLCGSNEEAGKLFKPPRATAQADPTWEDGLQASKEYVETFSNRDFDPKYQEELMYHLAKFHLSDNWQESGGSLVQIIWENRHFSGYWENAYSIVEGAIFASNNRAPRAALDQSGRHEYPVISHWSDVAFLQWRSESRRYESQTGSLAPPIRYIFRCQIVNKKTRKVIENIVDEKRKAADQDTNIQVCYTVSTSTPEGKALLATPNGAGVAYLLIQHKEQLGVKTITEIDIFLSSREEIYARSRSIDYSLRFHVSQVDTGAEGKKMEKPENSKRADPSQAENSHAP